MGKTTVKSGNSHYSEGGRMPSTTGNPSGGQRGNNPPKNGGKQHYTPTENAANMQNANKGQQGTNRQYAKIKEIAENN